MSKNFKLLEKIRRPIEVKNYMQSWSEAKKEKRLKTGRNLQKRRACMGMDVCRFLQEHEVFIDDSEVEGGEPFSLDRGGIQKSLNMT